MSAEVAHFDETESRTAGRLAGIRSVSAGRFVLVTADAKPRNDEMKAAGLLPDFRGIAVHDTWAPYDTFKNVGGSAPR